MGKLIIEQEKLRENIRKIKEYLALGYQNNDSLKNAQKNPENFGEIHQNLENNKKQKINKLPEIIAVVKSNGYGLDLIKYTNFLKEEGIKNFAVASTNEAIKLKKNIKNIDVLMMSGTALENEMQELVENDVIITISSKEDRIALERVLKRLNYGQMLKNNVQIKPRIHIKIDTGFGRYGYIYTNAKLIIAEIQKLEKYSKIEGIFSHFSMSFYKHEWTDEQYRRFCGIIKELQNQNINIPIKHIANSSAVLRFPQMDMNAVRIGSAFLGRVAVNNNLKLKPIGYLESEVSEIKILPKGWNIGYSNTYKTKREAKIALVPTGYAEGFHMKLDNDMLSFGNKLRMVSQAIKKLFKKTTMYANINGKNYPILGRIGMYHVTVDITNSDIKIGDKVHLKANPLYVDSSVERVYR